MIDIKHYSCDIFSHLVYLKNKKYIKAEYNSNYVYILKNFHIDSRIYSYCDIDSIYDIDSISFRMKARKNKNEI